MPTKIFNQYHINDNTLLAVAIICFSTLVIGTFIFLLARLVKAFLVVQKKIFRKDGLKPALKEASKVETVQLHKSVIHKNKTIQESLTLIQCWVSLAGLRDLSLSVDDFSQKSDAEFSTRIILELFIVNRSESLQLLIDFLNGDNKSSQTLAMALASLVVIALDIPQKHQAAITNFISNLFCWSPDSLLFDFVITTLTKFDQVGPTINSPLLRVVSVPRDSTLFLDKFVFSETPPIDTSHNFISKSLRITFCSANTMDDISLKLLDHVANDFIIESNILQDELKDISMKMTLPENLIRYYDKALNDLTSNELKGDADKHVNEGLIIKQSLFIEAMNLLHKQMRDYRTRMTAAKLDIEHLFSKLSILAQLQNSRYTACPACVFQSLESVKVACQTLLDSYKDTKLQFVQFQRVFVIIQLCDIQTIIYKDLKIYLNNLSEAVKQRYVSRQEIGELHLLTQKLVHFGHSLQKIYSEGDKQLLGEVCRQQCERQIFTVMLDCETSAKLNDKLKIIWEGVLPIVLSVQLGLFELGNIDLENGTEQAITHIQNDIFAVAYFNYTRHFDNYNMNFLDTITEKDDIAPLFEKVANGIFDFARLELDKFKFDMHRIISSLKQKQTT